MLARVEFVASGSARSSTAGRFRGRHSGRFRGNLDGNQRPRLRCNHGCNRCLCNQLSHPRGESASTRRQTLQSLRFKRSLAGRGLIRKTIPSNAWTPSVTRDARPPMGHESNLATAPGMISFGTTLTMKPRRVACVTTDGGKRRDCPVLGTPLTALGAIQPRSLSFEPFDVLGEGSSELRNALRRAGDASPFGCRASPVLAQQKGQPSRIGLSA